MIKVLYISWGLEVGGKEHVIDQLVRGISPERFTGIVWALRRKGPIYARLKEDGYPVRFFAKRPGFDLRTIFHLRREILKLEPDLIHLHDFTSTLAALSALFFKKNPAVIVTEHLAYLYLNPVKKIIYELLLRNTIAVTAVSIPLFRALRDKLGQSVPIVNIPNSIDLSRFKKRIDRENKRKSLGIYSPGPVIVMVGRLEFNKNYELLLRTANLVRRRVGDCHFLIVGDGSLRSSLDRLARKMGLNNTVHFLGERMDVAEIVKIADICVLSSRREGLPLVLLEYMGAARPVVATRVGGVGELIRDGEEGFLVRSGDAENFADRIIRLIKNPAEAREMGRKGREVVRKRFSLTTMIRSYEEVYQTALIFSEKK